MVQITNVIPFLHGQTLQNMQQFKSEDNVYVYTIIHVDQPVTYSVIFFSRSEEMEITFPIYKKEDEHHDYHTIDGLSFLTDDIVGK